MQRRGGGTQEGRVRIDIAGYRQRRREALERFTRQVAETVVASGEQKALEPMNAADRKVVHDTVNDIAGRAHRVPGRGASPLGRPAAGDLILLTRRSNALGTLGFLGPGPVERHVEHAEVFVAAVDEAAGAQPSTSAAAVASPASSWPSGGRRPTFVLVDSQARRVDFLEPAVDELGWRDRVAVVARPGRGARRGRRCTATGTTS